MSNDPKAWLRFATRNCLSAIETMTDAQVDDLEYPAIVKGQIEDTIKKLNEAQKQLIRALLLTEMLEQEKRKNQDRPK